MENKITDPLDQTALPNATGVLVLGILSIVFCSCYGVLGIILGIVALILAHQDGKKYFLSPSSYTESSYKNLKAGKVCAIVGLSLSCLWIVYFVIMLSFVLTTGTIDGIMEKFLEALNNS